ncbi:hypothetical protein AVKW3434_23720 [Acidovorax sp. SUPP3434]|uniref:hypothetical protein n=1 Tax=Acidovorax sp. SUPP3434 TaxID=2920880 RepID=UPI0023DE5630|nr:hypothetical protein [Acidovorax sp. SUPP3434]GKT02455.1 hypothetical protein AVKW3434_23720 [Acidovorax sp. SUPP3434]
MRDYWMTQSLLQVMGWGYVAVVLLALLIAAWAPRRNPHKALWVLIVLAVGSILPIKSYRQYQGQKQIGEARKQQYTKAKALFDERCKTAAEKINRTFENVEGVVWMKWRSDGLNKDQYALDDPYGKDCSGEGCIYQLLLGGYGSEGKLLTDFPRGYKFVETTDPRDGARYRYTGVFKRASDVTNEYFSAHVKSTGHGADSDGRFFALERKTVTDFAAKFGIAWEDISTREDRDYWIAGGLLRIINVSSHEVIAERRGYLMDTGQGSTDGFRDPWGWAKTYAPQCPSRQENAWSFVNKVLHPSEKRN